MPQDNHHDKGYLNIASSEPKVGNGEDYRQCSVEVISHSKEAYTG